MLQRALRDSAGSLLIDLVVMTSAPRTEIRGVDPWRHALRLRVAAPARSGEANREIVYFLADLLGVPSSDVTIVWGAGSREKRIAVAGLDRKAALERISAVGRS